MDEELKAMLEGAKAQGANDTDLGKIIDMYEADALKKKDSSQPTSIPPKLVSGTPTGSSGGKGFPKIDTNSVAPGVGTQPKSESSLAKEKRLRKELANKKVTPENMDAVMAETDALSSSIKANEKAKAQAKSKRVKELETSFYSATKNNDDDAVAEQRLNDAVNTNGIWNNVKSIAKKAVNTVIDGAVIANKNVGLSEFKINEDPLYEEKSSVKKAALKNKEQLSEVEVDQRAKELFKEKEKENLFLDRANSFLDNMGTEDKNLLKQDRYDKGIHLQEDNVKRLKYNAALQTVAQDKIEDYKEVESELQKIKENGQPFPEELYNKYTSLGAEVKQISATLNKNEQYVLNNKKDLGTAKQEFDLFKREYGDFNNFAGNIAVTSGELATGILGSVNYLASMSPNPMDRVNAMKGQEVTSGFSEYLKRERENLRKPVESIESAEGFLNYTSDLLANQIPILVATSTGAAGLGVVGLSSTGQKYTDMNDEVRQGKATYTPMQMAVAPFLYGGAEVISEIPTLSILKKGGRIIESIARNEAELITKTATQKAIEWSKDYGIDMTKEMSGEQFTNFTQNFNDKYILGKKDVGLLDNTGRVFKDTFTLTSILKAAPQTFGVIAKPFQSKTDLGTLDENSRKIIEFSKQLNTDGLSDVEKTVVQKQIDKVTTESSKIVANTIGKISDMPGELYDEAISLNSKAGEIKSQARIINDGNLANKEVLLKGLSEDYKAIQKQRNGIIDGKTTVVDVLPLKEQETLKKQAMEDLVTELNPDGTKDITITNEQVVARANEIYANEQITEITKTEPQAEVPQQTEAEKVAEEAEAKLKEIQNPPVVEQTTADTKEPVAEVSPVPSVSQAEGVSKVVDNDFSKRTDQELEDRYNELNEKGFKYASKENKEFNAVEKEQEKREWIKVMFADPETSIKVLNDLKSKDNSFIEKRDVRESISVVEKYKNPKQISDSELKGDFSDALFGNPTTWYADGLKLKYAVQESINRGATPESLIKYVEQEFISDGYDAKTAKETTAKMLRPIFENFKNEATPPSNPPTNGNVPLGASNVGENGITEPKSPAKESVPSSVDGGEVKGDAEVSDLDHAKDQIDKGVLRWNSDIGAERVNLGITWADIRKGEKDIKAGKANTVPAKRLIEALKTAKENGGYEYKQGSGGQMQKQFVSLEDVERANNEYELTDSEQKEVDASEFETAREYDKNFNSLSEEEQIEILENYENSQNDSGTPSADSGQSQSKNDVPAKKEGTGENSGTKEKTALEKAQEIRRAAKAKLVAKRQNLSIVPDPKQDAQDLVDYHKALVAEAKEHIKVGVKTVADFAKEIGEKVSISIKNAWQDANGEISPITKAEDLDYDFDTVDNVVLAEDNKESDKDLESFRDSWNKEPSSGEINQYDSRNTIEREHGEVRNNQDYEVQKDLARVQIGIKAIEHAKVLFGAEYIEKTLSFIEQANLGPEKKAVAYVLLENEMDARVKEFPDNVGVKKLQDLVRAKSQAFLANSARAMGAGRFRVERFRELAKNGFAEEEFTNAILTTQQIKNKAKIQQLSQVNPDDINAQEELQDAEEPLNNELKYTQEDFDRELQKAKDDLGIDYGITVFENLKRQAKKDKLSDKKEELQASKKDILDQIRKVANKQANTMSANPIPLEAFPLIAKLAKVLIQEGAVNFESVVNDIHATLKDIYKDISIKDIADILNSKPKKVISEATKRKIYINLLNKNIESLDAQIAAKERNVVTKEYKYKNDAEINGLRDTRMAKQEELAKVDPSYAESRKLATNLNLAQKSLDEYQRRIDENDLSVKGKDSKIINANLEKLRNERDLKRKGFLEKKKKYDDSLKEPVVPPTKEELADKKYLNDVNNKINSLNKRIDDLKNNKQKSTDGKSTVWNDKISELEKELKDLREQKKVVKSKVVAKQPLTDEEISQQKLAKKLEQREKVLADLIAGKKNDVNGKSSDWSAEISKVNAEIEGLRNAQKNQNKSEQSTRDIVKQALIDAGFSREVKIKGVVKKLLDWKKLAGEAGSIANIRKNVEEALKGGKYTDTEIEDMKDALEKEYVRLSEDIIEKGLNELVNRNAERKPVNTKSAAKKLAELYNYGLFEKSKDSYEKIINSVLGFNELDQKAFDEMKQIAKGYAVLMDSGLSDTELKDAINTLSRRQARLVATLAFSRGEWHTKLALALSEITNLSTRFKLVNLGNLAENISSGMMARAANNMMDAMVNGLKGTKTSNKAITKQSKINARAKLKGITFDAAESYGDTSSLLLNHSAVEDYFNNATTNKLYHGLISTYMAKPILEGADSFNKILITEAKMVRATIKVLQAKGMSNADALDYVAKAITGESMAEALVKAKTLIDKVNKESGKKLLNDTDSAIKSLAADIVKESLVSGGQISETELKAIYNAAYKSAGKDIGHVSNNWVTTQISIVGKQNEKRIEDAIKERQWGVASKEILNQAVWKNGVSTFIGGGTNWFIKGLQKAANPLSLISLSGDYSRLKMAGKLDVTTDEGIKNMEESLYRGMNLRSTAATMVMGAMITATIIGSMKATGGDDEIAEWLKNNPWAKKFFDKMVPDAVVLMLAIKDKDYGRYIAKMINVKADFFDDQKNIGKILEKYADGYTQNDNVKISEASGDLGVMIGKRFDFLGPVKAIKDSKQIYKGVVKGEFDKSDYYTSGFLNGFFQGGVVEAFGLRKDPDFVDQNNPEGKFNKKQKDIKEYTDLPKSEKRKIDANNSIPSLRGKITELENMKLAIKNKTPYRRKGGSDRNLSNYTTEKLDRYISKVNIEIEKRKSEAGDRYTEPKN